jgi:hypothetical protein
MASFVEEQSGTDDPERKRAWLREFLKANGKQLCEACGCCEMVGRSCSQCGGDGVDGHDCGEDTCCCLDPEDNESCDICNGEGGWMVCIGCCAPEGDD